MRARILIIDDDSSFCELLADSLGRLDFDVVWRLRGEDALALMDDQDFDVAIVDQNLGSGMSGLELCVRITENRPSMPAILVTGFGDMNAAVAAIRAGARDFITKPLELPLLEHAIERACRDKELREQIKRLRQVAIAPPERVGGLLGGSHAMQRVTDLIRRVAATDTTVLLTGESGTGKEVAARALHDLSLRAGGPFVALNCAAVPAELLESELFGHVRGAFTDARHSRWGLFQQADGGTLLLDEIGEMPLEMQPKLLRVLQERIVCPVGGNVAAPLSARIVAATNKELEEEVEAGRFREDLFYRLNVIQVHLPPLRARGNDISVLAESFTQKFAERAGKKIAGIAADAQRKLLAYSWPGNVRQLENCMERAVALTRSPQIELEDLPERVLRESDSNAAVDDVDLEHVLPLDAIERRQIERTLMRCKGNKTQAAKALGIDRRTLYRKLERWMGPNSGVMTPEPKARGVSSDVPAGGPTARRHPAAG